MNYHDPIVLKACKGVAVTKLGPLLSPTNGYGVDILYNYVFFFFFSGRDQYYRRLFFVGLLFREHPKAQPEGGEASCFQLFAFQIGPPNRNEKV